MAIIKKTGIMVEGLLLMGMGAVLSNFTKFLTVNPIYAPAMISFGALTTIYGFSFDRYSKLEKLFFNCGLYMTTKEGEFVSPKVIKTVKKDETITYMIKIPQGLCVTDFEKNNEEISQALNAQVSFSFENCLIMRVDKRKLKNYYPFELIECSKPLEICFGVSRKGYFKFDIEDSIHTLIAGSTGSGKSVLLRSLITALILGKKKEDIELHLVDFMKVELSIFKRSEMVKSFSSNAAEFTNLVEELKKEAERRLDLFESRNVVNISSWNKKYGKLPYKIIIIDEFASLSEHKQIMKEVTHRTAQDRKCGIHYIICTQRPSVDVIPGTIKNNVPTRISLRLATESDSRVVLDQGGAEKLRDKGNALVKFDGIEEIQVMYLSEEEAQKKIRHTFCSKAIKKVRNDLDVSSFEKL